MSTDNVHINKAVLRLKINTMIENGRTEITNMKKLKKFPIGSLISYINSSGVFKVGGFLTAVRVDSFSYIDPDFQSRRRVKLNKIDKAWVGSVYDVSNDFVSIIPTSQSETNFPVIVQDIVIFYATTSYNKKRFQNTLKYLRIQKWIDYFSDNSDNSDNKD